MNNLQITTYSHDGIHMVFVSMDGAF